MNENTSFSLFCGADILLPPADGGEVPSLPVFADFSAEKSADFSRSDNEKTAKGLPADLRLATFHFDGKSYQTAELGEDELISGMAGALRIPVRQFIASASPAAADFVLRARAYAHWSFVARFCSFCGGPLSEGRGRDFDGAKVCGACGRAFFPRISPAVIVLINKGEEILLAHNAKFPTGRHGLIAGFVEPGETLEETVMREVMEEAGIEIKPPRYLRSQPWPFPDSLMIAFEAEYSSGEARPDGEEIDHLGWFSLDSLPNIPPPGSVARFLIDRFIASRKSPENS